MFPREVGLNVSKKKRYLVLETHFDNPEGIEGNVDASGVRVYYTDKKRKYEGGSLLLGDSVLQRQGELVKSNFEYEHSCPTSCTEKFAEPINLFGSFLHMHTTGKEIYTSKFDADGKFVETVNKVRSRGIPYGHP